METTVEQAVENALNTIRPVLANDGGGIELVGIENGVAKVRMTGACRGCGLARLTLKFAVEKTVLENVPGVTRVEAV